MKLSCFCAILLISLAGSASAYDYVLLDTWGEHPVPEVARGAIAADAIVTPDGQVAGFIYITADRTSIHIEDNVKRRTRSFSTADQQILQMANYYSLNGDTLNIYLLIQENNPASPWQYPAIVHLQDNYNAGEVKTFEPQYDRPPGTWSGISNVDNTDLRFEYGPWGRPQCLVFSCRATFADFIVNQGSIFQSASTSLVLSLDLSTVEDSSGATSVARGNLMGNSSLETCSFEKSYYSWDFQDSQEDPASGTLLSSTVWMADHNDSVIISRSSSGEGPHMIFVGDFIDDSLGYDEMIYSGEARDLLGLHGNSVVKHVACYSFHSGEPVEEWYRRLMPRLDFHFEWGGIITEVRHSRQVAHMDVTSGYFPEVHSFPSIGYHCFFLSGPLRTRLNLLDLRDDTVRVYLYDAPTDVDDEPGRPPLPRSFSIQQNYPNPFNGQTMLTFFLPRAGEASVDVYNVLGRRIARLADGRYTSGTHRVAWQPHESVPSGIYFVSLHAYGEQRSVSVQYIK